MTDVLQIDPNDLTLGEIEDVEDACGIPFAKLLSGDMTVKAVAALVWVIRRRDDPAFTLDQARALKLGELDIAAVDVPPTGAAG